MKNDSAQALQRDYSERLRQFLRGGGEEALVDAYELGRRAVALRLSLLDFTLFHHRAIEEALSPGGPLPLAQAGEFLAEALTPYELTLRAYHENARLLGLGGTANQHSARVEETQKQLRTILDATTAVIYLRDDQLRFLFVNRRFEEVFGVPDRAVLGARGDGLLDPSALSILDAGDARAFARRVPQEVEETLVLNGTEAVYLSLKFPLQEGSNVPHAVCSVATDISERKRTSDAIRAAKEATDMANRALRETQAQLVHSAKMASIGQLVAGIAHEINSPLAFSLSHAGTARKHLLRIESRAKQALDDDEKVSWDIAQNRLHELTGGLERIGDLVLRLRTFSRLDEGEVKRTSIREAVESVMTILHHRLEGRISVQTDFEGDEWLECYPRLLNQALLNLVANAIDAIDATGKVTIHAGPHGGAYRIRVVDTGSGIPTDIRERIFEPFFTTKPVGRGTGLGLSITHSIVQKHGGQLEVSCPETGGTEMVVTLPLSVGPPP